MISKKKIRKYHTHILQSNVTYSTCKLYQQNFPYTVLVLLQLHNVLIDCSIARRVQLLQPVVYRIRIIRVRTEYESFCQIVFVSFVTSSSFYSELARSLRILTRSEYDLEYRIQDLIVPMDQNVYRLSSFQPVSSFPPLSSLPSPVYSSLFFSSPLFFSCFPISSVCMCSVGRDLRFSVPQLLSLSTTLMNWTCVVPGQCARTVAIIQCCISPKYVDRIRNILLSSMDWNMRAMRDTRENCNADYSRCFIAHELGTWCNCSTISSAC